MSKTIRIGSVSIPLESYVVGGTAILGIRGSGKTFLAKSVAEQLLQHGVPPIIFDAIGVWRFLKVARKGNGGKGFPIVVAGGKEPDLPLTPHSAADIVRAAMRENIPLVIDLYDKSLSKADWRRIVQTCFRTLLYENTGLRHIFLEEAAEYAPQKIMDGETYAEVEKLVRMGGNASIGITLINQRAQEVNKAVLDLCENMVLMRQRGAHAIDSLEKFMDRIAPDNAREIANTLPNLSHDAWVFTSDSDKAVCTRSAPIATYHPDRKKPEAPPAKMTVDTSTFVTRMQTDLVKVVEDAKANDPKELKRRIIELERLLKTANTSNGSSAADLKTAEEKGYRRGCLVTGESVYKKLTGYYDNLLRQIENGLHATQALIDSSAPPQLINGFANKPAMQFLRSHEPGQQHWCQNCNKPHSAHMHTDEASLCPPSHPPIKSAVTPGNRSTVKVTAYAGEKPKIIPTGEAAVLRACIQYENGLERNQLTVLTGYKRSSRDAFIARLKQRGFIDDQSGRICATQAGQRAMPDAEPLPTGQALQSFWFERLPEGERKCLQILVANYPNDVGRDDLDNKTGYKRSSRDTYLARLSAKELVKESGRGRVRASETLF